MDKSGEILGVGGGREVNFDLTQSNTHPRVLQPGASRQGIDDKRLFMASTPFDIRAWPHKPSAFQLIMGRYGKVGLFE
jgi:hypothetical protein